MIYIGYWIYSEMGSNIRAWPLYAGPMWGGSHNERGQYGADPIMSGANVWQVQCSGGSNVWQVQCSGGSNVRQVQCEDLANEPGSYVVGPMLAGPMWTGPITG